MNHQEVIDYIEIFARQLIAIAHTDAKPKFFLNIEHFIEKENEVKGSEKYRPVIVMEDRHRGRLEGNNDNVRDAPRYAFNIMRRVKKGDYRGEETAFDECKNLCLKFRARLLKDTHEEADTIARFVVPTSFNYRRMGPELESWHGCELSWEMSDNINDQCQYDPDDYFLVKVADPDGQDVLTEDGKKIVFI